jgi:hypothetical protein
MFLPGDITSDNFDPALVADHKPVDKRFACGFHDLHIIAQNAAFQTDADVQDLAFAENDTILHFTAYDDRVIPDR